MQFSVYFLGFLSLIISTSGVIICKSSKSSSELFPYLLSISILEFIAVLYPKITGQPNIFLFSLAFFIHFLFLTRIYLYNFIKTKRIIVNVIILFGILPMIITHLFVENSPQSYVSYDRAFYSFFITLLSLLYFNVIILKPTEIPKHYIVINTSVLLFFSVDTFLALATNYLIQEKFIRTVGWFWLGRALLLQFFYISLIYYGWKEGQPKQNNKAL